jgi:molecular chaperone GrpE
MFRRIVNINTVAKFGKQAVFQPKQYQFARFSTNGTAAPSEPAAAAAEATPTEPQAAVDPSKAKDIQIVALQKEVKEYKDQVLRSYAEEENVRRIARKDVDSARTYAISSFAKALLDVSDNLERALDAIPAEKRKNGDPTLKTLVEGIEMTDKNLQKVFHQFGVVKYGKVDDVFDPALHDALFNLPAENEMQVGTIGSVLKTGYKLKDRVIRAAEVGTRQSQEN